MSAEGWVVELDAVAADGDLTQLFPEWATPGVVRATANRGEKIRRPTYGNILSISVASDGTNGGIIELYDINGDEAGADVSSLDAITDAQYLALKNRQHAKRIYRQRFAAAPGSVIPGDVRKDFSRGLAARFIGGAGTVTLNISVVGGYYKYDANP